MIRQLERITRALVKRAAAKNVAQTAFRVARQVGDNATCRQEATAAG